jgi:hypothetical protein
MLRRFGLAWVSPFPLRVPQYPNHKLVSSPRLIKPSVQISCTGLSCVLRIKGYGADSSWMAFS